MDVPTQEEVDKYLNVLAPMDYTIDFDNPSSIWQLTMPEEYSQFRRKLQKDMDNVPLAYLSEAGVFARHFGRKHALTEVYTLTEDKVKHKNLLITTGTITNTARAYVDAEKRTDTAICNLRMLRPFAPQGLAGWASKAENIIVIDRNLSPGLGGIWAQEVRAWLSPHKRDVSFHKPLSMPVYSYIAGMGGVDVTEETIERILNHVETDGEYIKSNFVEDI
jgi:pyruvate/2-oxoacid:ferredoxin oxidoreductase alpha subunit